MLFLQNIVEGMNSKEIKVQAINKIRILFVAASIITGLIAGTSVEKYVVRIPAWQKMDILQWAEFSKYEYLGYGLYFYLIKSFICLILFSTILFLSVKYKIRSIKWRSVLLLVLSFSTLGFTLHIAPLMFSLPQLGNDQAAIKKVFDEVNYWGAYRTVLQLLCFIICIFYTGKVFLLKFFNS